jgi:endonuclease I/chitodextrinase
MKKNYTLLLLLCSLIGFAQAPAAYYDTATGTGYTLKTQLYNIIKIATDNGYDGLYTTYQTSDIDNFYENDGTILDMYSENPAATDPYNFSAGTTQRCGNYTNEGDCYNREHIIPQSIFNKLAPMVSDAHFIVPSDGKVNGFRSNFPHGNVETASTTSKNGSKLGTSAVINYTGTVFEPIDEFKGDIARMYLYFATRYENAINTWGKSYPMFDGSTTKVFTTPFLQVLLAWNNLDPVNAREISRNNAIYARQGNRNPYIDHPEYVNMIWNTIPDTENPTAATNLAVTGTTSSTISLSWTAGTDNTGIASYAIYVNGTLTSSVSGTTITTTIAGLTASTTYSFYVIAKDFEGNLSPASLSVDGTTTAIPAGGSCTGSTTENFENIGTGASSYATRTWTNPSTTISWTATDARTDQTLNTKAITIRNGSLTSGNISNGIGNLTITTQLKFGSTAGTFTVKVNGNAVGKANYSGTIGTSITTNISNVNISGNFTLTIDTNVDTNSNSTTNRVAFDDLTWTCYQTPLGITDFTSEDFKIYPNPSSGNFDINFDSLEKHSIEIYSSIGQKVFENTDIKDKSISISDLQQGIYFIKVTKDSQSIVKKIVIN